MIVRSLLVCALLVLSACGPHFIPGTQIADTRDSRAILDVMERYRSAVEARDAKALQALVSKSFRDNAGTEDPADDLTAENLDRVLPQMFARMDAPQVNLEIRRVDIKPDGMAQVIYYWSTNWRAPSLLDKTQRDSELEQMVLQKEDGDWRIVTGI